MNLEYLVLHDNRIPRIYPFGPNLSKTLQYLFVIVVFFIDSGIAFFPNHCWCTFIRDVSQNSLSELPDSLSSLTRLRSLFALSVFS